MSYPKTQHQTPIWKETFEIAEHVYSCVSRIIEDYPDEKWTTASKLRNAANDSLYYISQAVGNTLIETSAYDWNNSHKHLFTLQTMYAFAVKQGFIAQQPDIVSKIDDLLEQISNHIEASKAANQAQSSK